jgi:hypothetical protein
VIIQRLLKKTQAPEASQTEASAISVQQQAPVDTVLAEKEHMPVNQLPTPAMAPVDSRTLKADPDDKEPASIAQQPKPEPRTAAHDQPRSERSQQVERMLFSQS